MQVDLVLVVRIVQHRIEMDLIDFGDRGNVARNRLLDLDVFLALELEQMRDLERFLAIIDEQLGVFPDRALINTEHAELADEWIIGDLEYVGDDVRRWIRRGCNRLRVRTDTFHE